MHTNKHEWKMFGVQALACLAAMLCALSWSGVAFCGEIHDAVRAGDVKKVEELLKAQPLLVNDTDSVGATPLHWAAGKGYKEVVAVLLAYKADVNAKDSLGWDLGRRDGATGSEQLAGMFRMRDAKRGDRDYGRRTPLHWAAFCGSKEVVELLLANKADVNARDGLGRTPLRAALDNGKKDLAEFLRQHGAKE